MIEQFTIYFGKEEKERKTQTEYKGKKYIPESVILSFLDDYKLNIVIQFSSIHFMVKTTIKCLLEMPIINWSYNRPPDIQRCIEIGEHYLYEKTWPQDPFYLNYNNEKDQVFEIYDGSHRLKALQGLNLDPIYLEKEILINVRFNTQDADIIKAFTNLNKSIPVPNLYIHDAPREKKNLIEKIVNEWIVQYPSHFSSSVRPNIGNTNRDLFMNFIEQIYDKTLDQNEVKDRINDIHSWSKLHLPKKLSVPVLKKCQESGCYLFLNKFDVLVQYI